MPDEATFLEIHNFGFVGGDEQVKEAVGSTGGFTLRLAEAKAGAKRSPQCPSPDFAFLRRRASMLSPSTSAEKPIAA